MVSHNTSHNNIPFHTATQSDANYIQHNDNVQDCAQHSTPYNSTSQMRSKKTDQL